MASSTMMRQRPAFRNLPSAGDLQTPARRRLAWGGFCVAIGLAVCLSVSPAAAEVPVGWRGDGSGRFVSAYPPVEWSGEANVLWKTALPGASFGSPILVQDRLLVLSEPHDLLCLSASDGRMLWRQTHAWTDLFGAEKAQEIEEKLKQARGLRQKIRERQQRLNLVQKDDATPDERAEAETIRTEIQAIEQQISELIEYPDPGSGPHPNSRSTPTSDGKFVYVTMGNGIVSCHDLDGERVWMRFIEGPSQGFGHTASPLLIAGKLIVHFKDMVALDPATGEEVWRTALPARHGSPLATRIGTHDCIVTAAGAIVRAEDGQVLVQNLFTLNESSPILSGDLLFAAENRRDGMKAWRLSPTANGVQAEVIWERTPPSERRFASMIYHDGLLYSVAGPILEVVDAATGRLVYRQRLSLQGRSYPSPTIAGDKIFLSSEGGETVVIEPGRSYVEVSRNSLEPFSNNLLVHANRMFVRGMKHLYCIAESPAAQ